MPLLLLIFFLFRYEMDFMMSLPDDKQVDIIDTFNTKCRYLDDVLTLIMTIFFQNGFKMVST